MSRGLPVVMIHKGDSPYLPTTILQLRQSNPDSEIILVGDRKNLKYEGYLTHFDAAQYFDSAARFANVYKHYSTNGYEFELVCIQRWFVLAELMRQKQIDQCLYIDSDVLVYSDVNALSKQLAHRGMTVVGISGHTNFVGSLNTVERFCSFIYSFYAASNADETLRRRYQAFLVQHPFGGISDMTMFTEFRKAEPDAVIDLSVVRNGTAFDITLDTTEGYEREGDYKKIVWIDGKPHVRHIGTGQLVRFHTLHFQGKYKRLINRYATLSTARKLERTWMAGSYIVGRVSDKLWKK